MPGTHGAFSRARRCHSDFCFWNDLPEETDALLGKLIEMGLETQLVMMVGGVNPMDPADEDEALAQLLVNLNAAKRNGVIQVNSTSVETWMEGAPPKDDEEFHARVAQNIKLHYRAYEEAGLADSCIENWNIEFLRPGEFANFTSLEKIRPVISGLNEKVGSPFFKVLIDAAHCGDSGLTIPENEKLIAELGSGRSGSFHCSVPTRVARRTMVGGSVAHCQCQNWSVEERFVELFRHNDPALPLRKLEPGHGIDTTLGRTYTEVTVDGLIDTA